jgi:hypothetical protein
MSYFSMWQTLAQEKLPAKYMHQAQNYREHKLKNAISFDGFNVGFLDPPSEARNLARHPCPRRHLTLGYVSETI